MNRFSLIFPKKNFSLLSQSLLELHLLFHSSPAASHNEVAQIFCWPVWPWYTVKYDDRPGWNIADGDAGALIWWNALESLRQTSQPMPEAEKLRHNNSCHERHSVFFFTWPTNTVLKLLMKFQYFWRLQPWIMFCSLRADLDTGGN